MNPASAVSGAAATPQVRPETRPAQPHRKPPSDQWYDRTRITFRAWKYRQIETGAWPESAIRRVYPTPCNVVEDNRSNGKWDCLTQNERKILDVIRTYGQDQGQHARLLDASLTDWQNYTGMSRDEVRAALKGMRQKHILRLLTPRTRGERGPENRKKSRWLLPNYNDILASRRNDPNIAKDWRGYTWASGYKRSRRLLTPAEFEEWNINGLFPYHDRPSAIPDDLDRQQPQQAKPAPAATPPAAPPAAKDTDGRRPGAAPPEEAELQCSPELEEALSSLCEKYDRIIPGIVYKVRRLARDEFPLLDVPDGFIFHLASGILKGKRKVEDRAAYLDAAIEEQARHVLRRELRHLRQWEEAKCDRLREIIATGEEWEKEAARIEFPPEVFARIEEELRQKGKIP